jgi:hypothetical protein
VTDPNARYPGGAIGSLDRGIFRVFRFTPSVDRTRLVVLAYIAGLFIAFGATEVWLAPVGVAIVGYFLIILPTKRWEKRRLATELSGKIQPRPPR